MSWVCKDLAFLIAVLVAVPTLRAQEEERPLWSKCHEAIQWHHRAEVVNTEQLLLDLVSKGTLAKHSREWIEQAIEKAPSIDSCLELARERKKLLFWYVPTVAGQHVILPHLMDRYMAVGPLSDPDVVDLLNRRFVAIQLPAAGELAKRYNLEAPQFIEPGFLVLAPNGDVVFQMNRIASFNPEYFRHVIQTLITNNRELTSPSEAFARAFEAWKESPGPERSLLLAEEALRDGDHGQVRKLIAGFPEKVSLELRVRRDYLEARLLRFERDAKGALALLDRAARHAAGGLAADLLVERGRVQLKSGHFSEAHESFERSLLTDQGARQAEALYWFAALHFNQRQPQRAHELWMEAVQLHRDSLWAAKSDAYLRPGSDGRLGEGPLTRSMESIVWSEEDAYRLSTDTRWRRDSKHVGRIARRAVEFLLTQQRSDGSWGGLRWGKGADDSKEFHNFEMAISALCCMALRDWHGMAPNRIDDALERAEQYLLRDELVQRGDAMVWVYADSFRLLYLSRRVHELKEPARSLVHKKMRDWVGHIAKAQELNEGSLKHYVYASTFVTACATYCLHEARSRGVEVPDAVFENTAKVLMRARGEDGFYGYLVSNPTVTRTSKGASSRQPLCEWVMYLCGKSDEYRLHKALDIYFSGYDQSTELARKSNFHIPSLDNTAGYYFFHNFYPACRAAELTGRYRRKNIRRLLDLLCDLPEIDGTFVDSSFSYGKSYGTAMALMSLRVLTKDK